MSMPKSSSQVGQHESRRTGSTSESDLEVWMASGTSSGRHGVLSVTNDGPDSGYELKRLRKWQSEKDLG